MLVLTIYFRHQHEVCLLRLSVPRVKRQLDCAIEGTGFFTHLRRSILLSLLSFSVKLAIGPCRKIKTFFNSSHQICKKKKEEKIMSCFSCCEEDDINKPVDGGGQYMVKHSAGNLLYLNFSFPIFFSLLPPLSPSIRKTASLLMHIKSFQ